MVAKSFSNFCPEPTTPASVRRITRSTPNSPSEMNVIRKGGTKSSIISDVSAGSPTDSDMLAAGDMEMAGDFQMDETTSQVSLNWIRRSLIFTLLWRVLLLSLFSLICLPATLLLLPVLFIAHVISKQKAVEALKKSSVKVKGNDVLATWKVLVCIVVIPIIHLFYCFLVWMGMNWYGREKLGVENYGERFAIVFFFFVPFISLLNVLVGENAMRIKRTLRPLLWIIFHPSKCSDLVKLREECVNLTVHAVDNLGWGLRMDELGC